MTSLQSPANLIEKANRFIAENKDKVVQDFRNKYHLMAPVGWMNDPNGFVYYKGEYHLFYQFYPYESVWGPMHWGHAKSKDLLHWEHLPVALAPDQVYDRSGCFSGSAIVKDDKLYLMYTGHVVEDGVIYQTQCMAVSSDGIIFKKLAQNPVITAEQVGESGSRHDIRDPKMLKYGDTYYAVVATKSNKNYGRILLFMSDNLIDWEFKSILLEGNEEQGIMWECPDLFHLDGQDVLIMSPIQWKEQGTDYTNISSTVAFIGEMDWESGKLAVSNYHEMDYGMDFYAPQTCEDDQGRRMMVAWMQMWDRTIPSHVLKHNWAGSMSLPRQLHVSGDRLYQEPISFIYDSLQLKKESHDVTVTEEATVYQNLLTDQTYLKLTANLKDAKKFTIALAPQSAQPLLLTYDVTREQFSFSREHFGHEIKGAEPQPYTGRSVSVQMTDNQLTLEIFRDTSTLELFIDHKVVMSNTFYEVNKISDLILSAEGKVVVETLVVGGVE